MHDMRAPVDSADWCALSDQPLDVGAVSAWVADPSCGAVVTFTGLARDHAEGRPGVEALEYEAYEDAATERMGAVVTALRDRWPAVARVAVLHRTGELAVGDVAVIVSVSAPHRSDAFDAARFGIDATKATVPIWKRERWAHGESWGLDAQNLITASEMIDGRARSDDGGGRG